MNILMIVLRLIHIVGGVFWLGGTFVSALFLSPAIAATGEAGQRFMGHVITKGRMTTRLTAAAISTVLAGAALYWIDSDGLASAWTRSGPGWGFGIGALFALIGMGTGMMVGRTASRLGRIGSAAQGKPTQAQMLEMQAAQKQMSQASMITTVALLIALACMATARYWGL